MNKIKPACLIASLILCLATSSGLITQAVVRAQAEEETLPPEETLELSTTYPVLSGAAGEAFNFEVELRYRGGTEDVLPFDLSLKAPEGWLAYIQKSKYETERISAISLTLGLRQTILVVAMASPWAPPEPGEYVIRLEAVERGTGELRNSLDLIAKITAVYSFAAETTTGLLNIKATAGKESHLSIIITNTGTDTLKKITFSSSKPSGIAGEEWSITFEPDKIESLSPWDEQEMEVTIKPPSKTIAGDYMTTLTLDSDPKPTKAPPALNIRVTVGTPTKWGWIGAGIVVAVIAGLVAVFRQLGRR